VANRYRCSACGNLTRFDVTISRRTRAYHHFTIGGELRIEDETVLDERVDGVTCRWCGTGTSVEALREGALDAAGGVPAPDASGAT
jgi:hypothetical protein